MLVLREIVPPSRASSARSFFSQSAASASDRMRIGKWKPSR